jgi:hypothetical protein
LPRYPFSNNTQRRPREAWPIRLYNVAKGTLVFDKMPWKDMLAPIERYLLNVTQEREGIATAPTLISVSQGDPTS